MQIDLAYRTTCNNCDASSLHPAGADPTILTLNFPPAVNRSNAAPSLSLTRLIRDNFAAGQIDFRCAQCKFTAGATEKTVLRATPDLLCIKLNRPYYGAHGNPPPQLKDFRRVDIPFSVDLSPFLENPATNFARYSLYAVVAHRGTSATTGHYICRAKCPNQWHELNDDAVQGPLAAWEGKDQDPDAADADVFTPFLLFYERKYYDEPRQAPRVQVRNRPSCRTRIP